MKDSCSDVLKNSCIRSPAHSSAVAQVMCWPVLSSSLHLYTAPLFYSMAPAPLLWHPKWVKFILLMTKIKHIIHKLAPSVCTEPRVSFKYWVCIFHLQPVCIYSTPRHDDIAVKVRILLILELWSHKILPALSGTARMHGVITSCCWGH